MDGKEIKKYLSYRQLMCVIHTLWYNILFLTFGQNLLKISTCNLKTNGKKS
jgi:hypothetical protein